MRYNYEIEHLALPFGEYRVFDSKDQTEDFAWRVAVEHRLELRSVEWRRSDARCALGSSAYGIWLPNNSFGRSIITVLHELAHVAAPTSVEHGTEWFEWFAYLLRNEVSITAEAALRFEAGRAS